MPVRECPTCQVELEIPVGTTSGKRIRCPECNGSFVLPGVKPKAVAKKPIQVTEVIEEDEDERPEGKPGKRTKRKNVRTVSKPFWQTRQGMILNGLGLIGLGAAGIALYFLTDTRKKLGILIAGGLCILFGLGAVGKGLTGGEDDSDGDDSDED